MTNARIAQILRHAGVRVIAMANDRVVISSLDADHVDPLTRIILHLEPSAAAGHENMPSLEEARAMGLIRDDQS